jgi:hypothetical protein
MVSVFFVSESAPFVKPSPPLSARRFGAPAHALTADTQAGVTAGRAGRDQRSVAIALEGKARGCDAVQDHHRCGGRARSAWSCWAGWGAIVDNGASFALCWR